MNVRHIQLLSDAVNDLENGKKFYESQKQGVGEYFWDCLLSEIEFLIIHAGVHNKEYGCYRMLSRRFPYAIYYTTEKETAYIIAILPMRRNPQWIRRKIGERSSSPKKK